MLLLYITETAVHTKKYVHDSRVVVFVLKFGIWHRLI